MKKVLILVDSLRIGGAERALATMLAKIDLSRYDITVLSIADGGYFADLIKANDAIHYRYIASSKATFFDKVRIKLIYKFLSAKLVYKWFVPKDNNVEIAFCEGFTTKVIGASTNKVAKRIAWVHTDLKGNNWPLANGIFNSLEEEVSCYACYNTVVGVSDIIKNGLFDILRNKDIRRIYNLIDESEIKSKSLHPSLYALERERFNIVSVGRLEYVKGYDRLINAFSQLRNDGFKDITLTIVGDGSQRERLSEQINKNHLEDVVTLTGSQENPYAIMRGRDLFVCASRYEGYNIAIVEAMILNLPVLSTKCSGPEEVLQNGRYGTLCDNNEQGLYEGIKAYLVKASYGSVTKNQTSRKEIVSEQEQILEQLYCLL